MQTNQAQVESLVPPPLATLDAALRGGDRFSEVVTAYTDLERWLLEHPLEVSARVGRASDSLPEVDWAARISRLTPAPAPEIAVVEEPVTPTLAQSGDVARAIVLAVEYVAVECAHTVSFSALRFAANALLAIEPSTRRGITSATLDVLHGDRASRAVREALAAVASAEIHTTDGAAQRTIAVAAMAQAFLDELSNERAESALRAEVTRDPRMVPAIAIAHEAWCMRRGHAPDDPLEHARIVAFACERVRRDSIELDEDDLEEIDEPAPVVSVVTSDTTAEQLLARARRTDPARMRAVVEAVAPELMIHATIDALAPTDEERSLLIRWNAAGRCKRPMRVRVITGELALPVIYTLVRLGQAHAHSERCEACPR